MKVLLCRPQNIDIAKEISLRAETSSVVLSELIDEYENLKSVYEGLGVEVIEIAQDPICPGMIYAGDLGFAKNGKFILSKFKSTPRRKESKIIADLVKDLGYEVLIRKNRDYFEGNDLIEVDGNYFFGWGRRSSRKTQDYLEEIFGKQVTEFQIISSKYFHLLDCISPLDSHNVLYVPDVLSMIEQAKVCFHFSHPIVVEMKDAELFACGSMVIGKKILVNSKISKQLKTKIKGAGYTPIKVKFDEYTKLGAGIRTVSLLLD